MSNEHNEHVERISIKNEDSIVDKSEHEYLTFPDKLLIPCEVEEHEDTYDLIFDLSDLTAFHEAKNDNGIDKYKLLMNCAGLEALRVDYSFSMDPENIMYDINFMPRIKMRDGRIKENEFLKEYKALVGSTLSKQYSYEDFYKGGIDLFSKEDLLKKIGEAESPEHIVDLLKAKYEEEQEKLGKDNVLISNTKYKRYRRVLPILIVLIVLFAGVGVKLFFFDIPWRNTQIEANNYYLASDYPAVIKTLEKVDLSKMPTETKYIAALSGVYTSILNDAQKEHVLKDITLKTDSLYLNYWIEMGRSNASEAVDIGRRLGNEELELYALIVQKDIVERDMSLNGAKKADKVKNLEEQITVLEEKYYPEEEAAQGTL